jgi:hypothetical protein
MELLRDDLSRAEDMEALLVADLKTAVALRQSVLKAAFEGRLVRKIRQMSRRLHCSPACARGSAAAHTPRGRRGRKRTRAEAFELPLFVARADQPSADAD